MDASFGLDNYVLLPFDNVPGYSIKIKIYACLH
jgi:hypothetical protein